MRHYVPQLDFLQPINRSMANLLLGVI